MIRHYRLAAAAAGVTLALLLSSCSGGATAPSTSGQQGAGPSQSAAAGPISLGMWMWDEPGISGYWKESVKKYEETYSTSVDVQNLPVSEYLKQLTVQMSEGQPPDVLFVAYSNLPEVVAMGGLQPLDDVLSPELIGRIDESAKEDCTFDGKLMALPIASRNLGLLWNEAVFKDSGYSGAPTSPDQFLEMARKLTVKEGGKTVRYGAAMVNANEYATYEMLLMWTRAFGGDFWDASGNPTINTEAAVKALSFYKTLYQEELIPRGATMADARALYANGSAAMEIDGAWQYPYIKGISEDVYKNTRSAAVPWSGGTLGQTNITIAIPVKAKNADGAKAYLDLVAQPELLSTFLDYAEVIPQISGAVPENLVEKKPYLKPYIDSIATMRRSMPPWGYAYTEFQQIMNDTITSTLQSDLDPATQLDKAQQQTEQLIAEANQ